MTTATLSEETFEETALALSRALENGDAPKIVSILESLKAGEAAQVIHLLSPSVRSEIFWQYAKNIQPEAFTYLDEGLWEELAPCIVPEYLVQIIQKLESDDAFTLLDGLPDEQKNETMHALSHRVRKQFEAVQSYPEDSAARIMQQEVMVMPSHWTVEESQRYLSRHRQAPQLFYNIFLVNKNWQLEGVLPLSNLLRSDQKSVLIDIAAKDAEAISASEDKAEVALLFRRYALISAPVVDDAGKLLGVITADDVLNVVDEEAEEDIMHLGGVGASDFYAPVMTTTLSRLQWLLITFLNTLLASAVLSQFSMILEKKVALAILMPIVAAMGGNAGTQVVTVVVRAIATHELSILNMGRTLVKASLVSFLNGLIFAIILAVIAAFWFQDIWLGVTLGSALFINMIWAGIGGTLLPILVHHLGLDPALSAGPILTTTTDVLGFAVFLGLAKLMLF